MKVQHSLVPAVTIILTVFFASLGEGHDWPMWRYDAGRGAVSREQLPAEMHLQWVRELAPPKPAWPTSQDRLQFDASYEPVVAGKTIFVGSMVSDRVTAYDTETGTERWRFYTDGPVRFAPVVYGDKLYFGSDDGFLYCLNTDNGSLVHKFLGGPAQNKVIGNNRLVSMWPIRGGPVQCAGKIYFAAGIWPFMGTFIHAIDAETGDAVWTNSGSGATYLMQPHDSPAFAGVAPQGYIVAAEDKLLVSGGRSVPAAYDRRTGRFLYYHLAKYGKAGAFKVMASGAYFFNRGVIHRLSDGHGISGAPASVIADEVIIGVKNDMIIAYKLEPGAEKAKGLWQNKVPPELKKIHIKAGDRLYGSGDNGAVIAMDIPINNAPARISWRDEVDGNVWNMIAADGKLFVVTIQGGIYCFGGKKAAPRIYNLPAQRISSTPITPRISRILKKTGSKEGYCLLLGLGSGELLEQLLNHTQLHIIALDPDAAKVTSLRRKLDDAGVYGARVAVHTGTIMSLKLPPYLANLIVSEDIRAAGIDKDDACIKRIFNALRPYGGTACLKVPKSNRSSFVRQTANLNLDNSTVDTLDGFVLLRRVGPLPDTADWTHQYGDSANTVLSGDKRVKAPLGLLWFGGPPNDKILPRHGHGPSPQVVGGRLFIEGRNILRAVDVYTGRMIWERQFPDLGKFYDHTGHQPGANEIGSNYVSLPDAIYVVYRDAIHKLDPATGQTAKKFALPGEKRPKFGFIAAWQDLLITTSAPISVPLQDKRKQEVAAPRVELKDIDGVNIDADYASSSRTLVVMDRHTGRVLWKRPANYSFRHNCIAAAAGKIFCIDGMSETQLTYVQRRGLEFQEKPTLYVLDARAGEVIWKTQENIFGTWLSYSVEHDILLQAGSQSGDRARDEAGKGMIAYRASDGEVLWHTDESYKGPPILHHEKIITQTGGGSGSAAAEAKVFNLLTGRRVTRTHPLTGQTIPWTWVRFKGCNTAVASENLLTFRSASGAFVDLNRGQGTASIGGFKSGCTSNLIVANGVLNAPDYTRTCSCSYQNQASLALVHMPEVEHWTFDYYPSSDSVTPVRQVGINFGAPGNRYAENGTLWLEFPSVGGPSPDIPVRAKHKDPRWLRFHSSRVKGEYNWITASGVTSIREVSIRMFLQPGKNASKVDAFDKHISQIPIWSEERINGAFEQLRPYTVRLYFAELEGCEIGQRVFNVSLQNRLVLEAFDIVKDAGGADRCVVKEFKGIEVKDDLTIALAGKNPEETGPLLCGIEIIAEGW